MHNIKQHERCMWPSDVTGTANTTCKTCAKNLTLHRFTCLTERYNRTLKIMLRKHAASSAASGIAISTVSSGNIETRLTSLPAKNLSSSQLPEPNWCSLVTNGRDWTSWYHRLQTGVGIETSHAWKLAVESIRGPKQSTSTTTTEQVETKLTKLVNWS